MTPALIPRMGSLSLSQVIFTNHIFRFVILYLNEHFKMMI
jgi:hypothetical protein